AFARQTEPMHSSCNINDIVENTLHILDHVLKENNITYITKLDFGLPETIADKAQIQQVLLNIVVNAQQAMSGFRGRGNILIQTKYVDDLVKISVKDDGPGISTEEMERIFEPFFTTKHSGTGLGLSICHGIIAEHNGMIYAESEDGKGATFIVELPVIKQESEEKVKPLILPNPLIKRKE
ncbi:MAG: ATP-binding protein, partial [Dehalococcoidia bacterium]